MPEGDTVFQTARRLHEALAGDVVTRFELRVPQVATADLTGETVHGVIPRGKHLLQRIGDMSVHSHLKMEGQWHLYRPGEAWRAPAFKARAIVGTARALAVGFDLAMVDVVPTDHEDELVGYLGPDTLGPDWDAAEAARRLSADERPAHVALLDQRNLAGLGNEYVNELLFLRGIDPHTPASAVDTLALAQAGARLIRGNRDRARRTFTGIDKPGQRTWVYRRARQPCRRCGTTITETTLGADPTAQRNVFWCPRCQPAL